MKRNLFTELKEGMDALRAEREARQSNPHIGSSFDDFLDEDGRLEEATETAKKRIEQIKHK